MHRPIFVTAFVAVYLITCTLMPAPITAAQVSSTNDRWPRFSPDGKYIAFNSTRSGSAQIYVMREDGSDVVALTHNSSPTEKVGGVRWLRDGNLLFESMAPATLRPIDYDLTSVQFIEATRDGTELRVLYEGINQDRAAISPSGNELIFEGAHGAWSSKPRIDVYRFDVKSLTLRALTDGKGEYIQAAWSPDGASIAYGCTKTDDTVMQICVMDSDGRNTRVITHTSGSHQWPSWSPDSKHLAFFVERRHGAAIDADIGTVDVSGTNERIITQHAGTQRNETPDWSPDGKKIAFQTDRNGHGLRIASMNVDGTDVRMLTT